jgi:DNA-binding NarL/FixJ family response regulator
MTTDQAEPLTARQKELLQNIVTKGYDRDRICDELCISTHTYKAHMHEIYRKLGVTNVSDLILFALRNGLAYLSPNPGDTRQKLKGM